MIARLGIAAMWLLHWLPRVWLGRIGEVFGGLLHALAHERRRVCRINLERCFPQMAARSRAAIERAHFRALGRSLLERALAWWCPREEIVRLVRIDNPEHLEAARGGAVILLAPHFVALDMGLTRLSAETDLACIYARQKSEPMNRMLLHGRSRFGRQRMFSRQEGIRPALAALRDGLPLYYLPDQDYGARDALFVPFFGVPAATITALARLSRLADARVVPCVTRMLAPGEGYALRCYAPWEGFPGDDDAAATRRMNAFIEERVREMPEQYLWTHKRFKTRPEGEARWY